MSAVVRSQAELDAALAAGADVIEIHSERGVWLTVSGSASVVASDSASVRASDSASVVAYDSASVRAYGSASVVASDSASVRAYGSASVVASDSASVVASDSASVRAGSHTAVHLHSASVHVTGGVVIDHTKVDLADPKQWCAYHGVTVTRGIATLYKAVNDQWTTDRGTDYSPGTKPTCDDWTDRDVCGGGLHFGPTPSHARQYHPKATRFVEVGVRLSELRPITGPGAAKAKAPRVVRACVEVDVHGKQVTQ